MTQHRDENLPIDDDPRFDLLVDGELDEQSRRRLLGGLDDRPGGWRRCALAFLEAQAWRQEFGALGRKPASSVTAPQTAASATSRPRRRLGRGSAILGMAASFLLAAGLTSLVQDFRRAGIDLGGGPGLGVADMMGGAPGMPASGQAGRFIFPQGSGSDVHLSNLRGRGPDGSVQTATLPAVPRNELDERWVRELPPAIPPELRESFERAGHEVRPSRRLVPFQMPDGRRVVFPVDQLDVRDSDNPAYQ